MTKNEIINEIKSVVMNNGGEVKHGQIRYFINENGDVMADHSTRRGKNVNYESKAQLEADLDVVKMLVEKYCNTEAKTVETEAENTENTVEVEKNDNNVEDMKFTEENKDILFKCIWGAFRYFSNMERREVSDYEFAHLVRDMYQTMCGEIETDSEWDEYFDIEESMLAFICEESGAKQINKNHPNEDCYDTIILPLA